MLSISGFLCLVVWLFCMNHETLKHCQILDAISCRNIPKFRTSSPQNTKNNKHKSIQKHHLKKNATNFLRTLLGLQDDWKCPNIIKSQAGSGCFQLSKSPRRWQCSNSTHWHCSGGHFGTGRCSADDSLLQKTCCCFVMIWVCGCCLLWLLVVVCCLLFVLFSFFSLGHLMLF